MSATRGSRRCSPSYRPSSGFLCFEDMLPLRCMSASENRDLYHFNRILSEKDCLVHIVEARKLEHQYPHVLKVKYKGF